VGEIARHGHHDRTEMRNFAHALRRRLGRVGNASQPAEIGVGARMPALPTLNVNHIMVLSQAMSWS
jgi:hypothetical protein